MIVLGKPLLSTLILAWSLIFPLCSTVVQKQIYFVLTITLPTGGGQGKQDCPVAILKRALYFRDKDS